MWDTLDVRIPDAEVLIRDTERRFSQAAAQILEVTSRTRHIINNGCHKDATSWARSFE